MAEVWKIYNALYLDVDSSIAPLLEGTASTRKQGGVTWVMSDNFLLRIYFRRRGAIQSPSTSLELAADTPLVLGGKLKTGGGISGPPLVSAAGWVKGSDGDDVYYETTLNLKTEALIAAGGDPAKPITLQVDIEVGENFTFVIPVTIIPQAYDPDEPAPVSVQGGGYRFRSLDVDWATAGAYDVSIPDPWLVIAAHLTTDVSPTDLDYDVGTPAAADALAAAEIPFPDLRSYTINQIITGGGIRVTINTPSSVPATGKLIVTGVAL